MTTDPADPSVQEPTPASHIQRNCRAIRTSLPVVLGAIDDGDHDLALEWIENMQSQLRGLHQMLSRAKQNTAINGERSESAA